MHETAVRDRIKRMLATGSLPRRAANQIAAGYGDETTCEICGETISRSTVMYQLRFGGTHEAARSIVMHFRCYEIWEDERVSETDGEDA
jgi:hypothetical protein